ncbi:hypothetical protein CC2G_012245 [Coprinopsis cinerea AmutBmut pab1-1]|nr:hypothetical protein CC2G_012245 [Coprinopsis cinerea AmutBmut pab1-1]
MKKKGSRPKILSRGLRGMRVEAFPVHKTAVGLTRKRGGPAKFGYRNDPTLGRSTHKFQFPAPSRGYVRRQRLSQQGRYTASYQGNVKGPGELYIWDQYSQTS